MRVQRISYGMGAIGRSGTIVSHKNNLILVRFDNGVQAEEFYWNCLSLDDEARDYLEEVKRTAIPIKTILMQGQMINKEKQFAQLDKIANISFQEWQAGNPIALIPNQRSVSNAKAVVQLLCAAEAFVDYHIYPIVDNIEGGIVFEFDHPAIEMRFKSSGEITIEQFEPIKYETDVVGCPRCGYNHSVELHTCPFAEEINGDSTTLCQCCKDCEYQCAQDI